MDTKAFYLKTFLLANHLTENQLASFSQAFTQREARKGQALYMRGASNQVFLLISGKVKILETNSHKHETIKELLAAGDLFGNVTLQNEPQATEYAEVASERAIYFTIAVDTLTNFFKLNPLLMLDYMAKVGNRFKSLENRYVFMMTQDVKARLMYYFKEWARKEGKSQDDGKIIVKNSLTHHDLANLVSTSRQTVTVILNELKDAGVLRYNRKEYELSPLMLAS